MNELEPSVILDVAIVGAGIAGLAAAISMRRAGHNVTVYERSSFKNEVGAAINMPPQATRIMRAWDLPLPGPKSGEISNSNGAGGERGDEQTGTILKLTRRVDYKTAETMSYECLDDIAERYGAQFVSYHRAELGNRIALRSPVSHIDCQTGELEVTHFGGRVEVYKHDLLIIADGINTSFIPHFVGREVPLYRSGLTCYRTLIPTSKILSHSIASRLFVQRDGSLFGHNGISGTTNPHTGVYMIAYPCRKGALMDVAVFDRPREDRIEKNG
ncbi:hypothetical protein LTR37_005679 [Vermiconidia calcicola]|uniref:Uncharacterized protein n=1 Tax=Vermiconidia calcicola TaxID=1690605 RepID=A0ACC3NID2_9PEZI|nr:hypothetical protein LTR37_005679 [Vermiconidia calcicola]